MNFFTRLFTRTPRVPDWAAFFTLDDYSHFLALVQADFDRRQLPVTIDDGQVSVKNTSQRYGLQNLAQVCHQIDDRALWPEAIADHFAKLAQSEEQIEALKANMHDFERVKPFLSLRLYPADQLAGRQDDPPVARTDLEGTLTVLVIDLPDAVLAVNRSMAAPWARSDEELFAVARDWLRRDDSVERGDAMIGDSVEIRMAASEGFYAASQALILDELDGFVGTHGALVGVPHRHGLISYPIEGAEVMAAVNGLLPVLGGMFRQGPGSISPALYWYRAGAFIRLPVEEQGDTLVFMPPPAFIELLEQLATAP